MRRAMKSEPPAATAAPRAKRPRVSEPTPAPAARPVPRPRTRDGADVGGGSQPWMDPGRPPK